MTELRPFRALRYDPKRSDLGRVLVPPYDVVAPHERDSFFQRDPHNAIRLELTRRVEDESDTDYAEVATTLAAWQRDGVLVRDKEPSLYALRQDFAMPDGKRASREGFFALIRLEAYENRVVRPHERTLSGPKADRLKIMRAAEANLSPVFFLYEDAKGVLDAPLSKALQDHPGVAGEDAGGTRNRLVPIAEGQFHQRFADFMRECPVVIADGHHRYETALAYRDERPDLPGAGWLLGYFANAYASGTCLLPIHRVLLEAPSSNWRETLERGLKGWTATRVSFPDSGALSGWLDRELASLAPDYCFAADDGSGDAWIFRRARAGETELSIRVLHDEVLRDGFGLDAERVRNGAVAFPKSASEAARMVRAGEGHLALYLNPLRAEDVFAVTGAGEVLPQKSTFFFPKLPSGLLFRLLGDH